MSEVFSGRKGKFVEL